MISTLDTSPASMANLSNALVYITLYSSSALTSTSLMMSGSTGPLTPQSLLVTTSMGLLHALEPALLEEKIQICTLLFAGSSEIRNSLKPPGTVALWLFHHASALYE